MVNNNLTCLERKTLGHDLFSVGLRCSVARSGGVADPPDESSWDDPESAEQEESITLMHFPRFSKILGLLPLLLVGCSTTAASRFGGTPQSKSITVVGERPLPVSTGEPGGKVVASEQEPEPRRNPRTRISGRVLDQSGEPVSGAIVRLADGGGKGGREIRATSDQSGGFTLNGLRPGSSYVLIAESEDEGGPIIGRVEAQTAETGVEINLDKPETTTSHRGNRTSRARPISQREEPVQDNEIRSNVLRDEIDSPADTDTVDPGPPEPEKVGRPQLSTPQPTAGWRNGSNSFVNHPKDRELSPDRKPIGSRSVPTISSEEFEEETNPLPPALDRAKPEVETDRILRNRLQTERSARSVEPRTPNSAGEIKIAPMSRLESGSIPSIEKDLAMVPPLPATEEPTESKLTPDFDPETRTSIPQPEQQKPFENLVSQPSKSASTSIEAEKKTLVVGRESPDPLSPQSSATVLVIPDTSANIPASQPVFSSLDHPAIEPPKVTLRDDYNPFAGMTHSDKATASHAPISASDVISKPTSEALSQDSGPRKKWGDVAERVKPGVVVEPTKATLASTLFRRKKPSVNPVDASIALCSFDTRLRKINDFRLPDLEGKPVRFQDLNADFVLLDFWGTWCAPCLDSIPYLVELQKKYGPDKLKVVGIACEDAPLEARKAKVDEVSRKYGINYPILMSTMDGKPCPVQQALQVQAMPTLILVDRRGQVLWRNAGSTPAVESRLDRILALSMSRGETARR